MDNEALIIKDPGYKVYKRIFDEYRNKGDVSVLDKYRDIIMAAMNVLKFTGEKDEDDIIEADLHLLLQMCQDYYLYNSSGDPSLVPDKLYDDTINMMNKFRPSGNIQFYSDFIPSAWPIVKNEYPFLVGTLDKAYEFDKIDSFLLGLRSNPNFNFVALMPKYDGISCAMKINVKTGLVEKAITRGSVVEGQLITDLVNRAKIYTEKERKHVFRILKYTSNVWYAKCEILMSSKDFEELNNERLSNGLSEYANRRSAVSGIVNSPKNLDYAKYLTIMPLYWINDMMSICQCYVHAEVYDPRETTSSRIFKHAERIIREIRKPEFPYRVDGVVLWPFEELGNDFMANTRESIDYSDLMKDSIAYKINTNYNYSTVQDVYPSVGRTGKVTPMAILKPVEVNETTVSEVSLSSYNKFLNMDLHYNETVQVFSAGDSIPQMRKLAPGEEVDIENNYEGEIVMQDFCPYCKQTFAHKGQEWYCVNPECPRLVTGKIINFIDKIGIQNIKDTTIETLYGLNIIRSIEDIFRFVDINDRFGKRSLLESCEGFGKVSVQNMFDNIMAVFNSEIPMSRLLASIGIRNASVKTFKNILMYIRDPEDIFRGNIDESDLIIIPGVAETTARLISDGIHNNHKLLNFLKDRLKIYNDYTDSKGSIVFTGFRNKELEKKLQDMGYEVSESLTKDTTFLLVPVEGHKSSKVEKAKKYGISIVPVNKFIENNYYI